MSAGAVFKLIANDGKADRLIMATALLNQRILDVTCARKAAKQQDPMPTLIELERTHILYVNAHFKPFAAIGFEYNKVRPQSGTTSLGSGVTFSIPQFGDFFHDMVCRVRLSQVSAKTGIIPIQTNGGLFPSNDPTNGTTYKLVDVFGKTLPPVAASSYRNFVRYCEYPGIQLLSSVKFDVNGNPLDEYDTMVPVMLEKFCTTPGKRTGHDRLVGQETPLIGYGGVRKATVSDADSINTPKNISKFTAGQSNQTVGLFTDGSAANSIGATTVPTFLNSSQYQYDVSREVMQFVNGPQTPKPVQPPLEIWSKLRFWFNDDVRLSIPSVSIPFGQRYIAIDMAQQSSLVYEVPSVYIEKTTVIGDLAEPDQATSITKTYTPLLQYNGINDISIEKLELYINNIFVNPEIHDIYIKRIGFSLIRVYRQHTQRCNADGPDEKLLSQLKWPIEYMFVGLRPSWNTKAANANAWRDWHRMTRVVNANANQNALAAYGANDISEVGQISPDHYFLPVPTVDTLTLTSHGITIFDGFNDTFYNQYLPLQYGGTAIVTPEDPGALFVNMALFPRSYQPSGHLNISRARETYLKWTSSYITSSTPADLIVVAVAINFILISDGSAVLRYST
jgi:hypothetical protein